MNKKLMPKPDSIVMETRRQWTYATLRPLEAWMLGPLSLPESQAIYHPKSGKRSVTASNPSVIPACPGAIQSSAPAVASASSVMVNPCAKRLGKARMAWMA